MTRLTEKQRALLSNPIPYSKNFPVWNIIEMISEFLGYIECGRHRATFMLPSGRAVIKVPLCKSGVSANLQETQFSSTYPWLVARTRMFGQSALQVALDEAKFIDGRAIASHYVPQEQWTNDEKDLYWAQENIILKDGFVDRDILQAGRDTRGRLVLFDCNNL